MPDKWLKIQSIRAAQNTTHQSIMPFLMPHPKYLLKETLVLTLRYFHQKRDAFPEQPVRV